MMYFVKRDRYLNNILIKSTRFSSKEKLSTVYYLTNSERKLVNKASTMPILYTCKNKNLISKIKYIYKNVTLICNH